MSAGATHGRLDRLLHRFAFATRRAQLGLADLEQWLFRAELERTVPGAPVFVTALPRAGTTMLHELFAGCAEFATHTYRDMPFVLCPMLWRALSARLRRPVEARERAHGDGITITVDSPAALEEMLWQAYWPEHYGSRSIAPWPAEAGSNGAQPNRAGPEFRDHFAAHRHKVIALRARHEPRACRYLAKNNLHVARLPLLWATVPEALVVVPFRDPVQQAASLLRQHERFLALHREDAFARRYMAGVGHFEFGANLRPVDFGGWLGARPLEAARELPFWLEYWLATYRHVLDLLLDRATHERLVPIDFERLARSRDVTALGARLGIVNVAELQRSAERLRPLQVREVDLAAVPPSLLADVRDTFAALARRTV
jgi:hypothetical protein